MNKGCSLFFRPNPPRLCMTVEVFVDSGTVDEEEYDFENEELDFEKTYSTRSCRTVEELSVPLLCIRCDTRVCVR